MQSTHEKASPAAKGPLDGIVVIDLSSVVVGPVCSLTLADHGAEVIKVESPDGDLMRQLGGGARNPGMTGKFMNFNRNKKSICIDLKNPSGQEVMYQLISKADVFITNMRPGALEKLGLDFATLQARNSRLIYCQMCIWHLG